MALPVRYRDVVIGSMRLDILVGGELIVELKSVPELSSLHVAQASSYLRASGLSLSLLLNFNVPVMTKGSAASS